MNLNPELRITFLHTLQRDSEVLIPEIIFNPRQTMSKLEILNPKPKICLKDSPKPRTQPPSLFRPKKNQSKPQDCQAEHPGMKEWIHAFTNASESLSFNPKTQNP